MKETALITGATAGIGFEFANLLAENGYDLVLVARDENRLANHAKSLQDQFHVSVKTIVADLADNKSPRQVFDKLQAENISVTTLVNNAGSGVYGPFVKTDLAREIAMLELNMVSLAQLTKLFLKPMLDARHGRILNVASTVSFQPGPGLSLYSASKAFVHSFSCALAVELKGTGVTVTCLCPGGTKTEFQERAGMGNPRTRFPQMSARSVAEIGYRAMLKGRPVVVAGWKNKLMVAVSKKMPTMWAARAAGRINHNR